MTRAVQLQAKTKQNNKYHLISSAASSPDAPQSEANETGAAASTENDANTSTSGTGETQVVILD